MSNLTEDIKALKSLAKEAGIDVISISSNCITLSFAGRIIFEREESAIMFLEAEAFLDGWLAYKDNAILNTPDNFL